MPSRRLLQRRGPAAPSCSRPRSRSRARVAAVAALAIAFGVERPLTAGLLAVAAIELVAMLPISIGGAGMAGGALAFAFAAHGAPAGVPVAAGMALAAVETATAVTVGGLGGLFLALPLLGTLAAARLRPGAARRRGLVDRLGAARASRPGSRPP